MLLNGISEQSKKENIKFDTEIKIRIKKKHTEGEACIERAEERPRWC
jgi:hypothetical protein